MKTLLVIFTLMTLWPIVASATGIEMVVGDQRDLALKGPAVTVTSPQVIKVKIVSGRLHVAAKKPGYAQISFGHGHQAYAIVVCKQKVSEAKKQLAHLVKSALDIKFETRPEKLIVSGTIMRLGDWHTLQDLRRAYKDIIIIEAKPSEVLLPLLRQAVSESLDARSISSAQVSMRDQEVSIDHHGHDKDQRVAVQEVADNWGVKAIESTQNVELRPMVEVEISIAEVKKNSFKTLGLKTPGVYSATVLPSSDLSSAAATFNPIGAELHAGFDNGSGRVIANPKLLCRSGETAHFVAGGEIPIKIASWKTSDIFWKRYGVILDITPLADANDGISTRLVTEISLIDESHKVDGIPGFLTNRIETHFDLKGSKTIALSGLIKSETGRSSSGIPGLADIPILGELFKSRDYRDNRTELVVFVTPRIILPDDRPSVTPLKNFLNDSEE